jgi:hypothetical protein
MTDDPRTHRVEFDVPVASDQVMRGVDHARAKAALPKRARSAMAPVEVLRIALTELFHQQRAGFRQAGRQKQVHMVRHQAIRVDRASDLRRQVP